MGNLVSWLDRLALRWIEYRRLQWRRERLRREVWRLRRENELLKLRLVEARMKQKVDK
jgi:hypothetical protein